MERSRLSAIRRETFISTERVPAPLGRPCPQRRASGGDRYDTDGYREVLGICEGAEEGKADWSVFLQHLKERGLTADLPISGC
jgi:hypothetical protein